MKDSEMLAERVDVYIETIKRLEPDIAMIDASAFYASAAISLKRIADILEKKNEAVSMADLMTKVSGDEYVTNFVPHVVTFLDAKGFKVVRK